MIAAIVLTASLALPDTRSMMIDVEAALVDAGYQAAGYAALLPPAVDTVPALPRGDWGWSVPGVILISADQPEACLRITLAHELAHDATRRMDLALGVPVETLRSALERIAEAVEVRIANRGLYAPNCLGRRH